MPPKMNTSKFFTMLNFMEVYYCILNSYGKYVLKIMNIIEIIDKIIMNGLGCL